MDNAFSVQRIREAHEAKMREKETQDIAMVFDWLDKNANEARCHDNQIMINVPIGGAVVHAVQSLRGQSTSRASEKFQAELRKRGFDKLDICASDRTTNCLVFSITKQSYGKDASGSLGEGAM